MVKNIKKKINVNVVKQNIALINNITFAQTPYWFPQYDVKDLKMDILCPFAKTGDKLPLIIWICGGAWLTLDKAAHIPNLMYFAQRGFIVASVEYRMSNCAKFPSQLHDIKSAIRYLKAKADVYRIDTGRIVVMGESAGGYLAAMAGVTSGDTTFDLGDNLQESSSVNAVVDYYGLSDFVMFNKNTNAPLSYSPETLLLGYNASTQPDRAKTAGVIAHIKQTTPPFLLLHGDNDNVVPCSQSEVLYRELTDNSVYTEYYVLNGAGHADMCFYQEEINERILMFLKKVLYL